MGIFDACLDIGGLIGRDPSSIAADYDEAIGNMPDTMALVLAEHRAMEDLLVSRSWFLAPTNARSMAIALMPGGAMLCQSLEEVDAILEVARDWIAAMGDPGRHARAVTELRKMGEDVPEARMLLCMDGGGLVLDIHDETTIIVMLIQPDHPSILIGAVEIDQDGDNQEQAKLPTLVA